jgi:MFS family permease
VSDFSTFLGLSLVYGLIYAPTLALTNSLAFHHLPDRDRDFGKVRVWGTIGWIVVGIAMGHWLGIMHTPAGATEEAIRLAQDAGRSDAFKLSAILGAFMAVYCLTLPHTPPAKEAAQKSATLAALGEIGKQPLLTLFLLAVPISMIHQFYFVHTSGFLSDLQRRATEAQTLAQTINKILGVGGGGLMTIGQMTEILVLAGMPIFAKQASRKTLLAIGIIAYGARMALFAYTTSMPAIILGVALHGFCFGCFVFVAFMVVDENTTADVRASAQNLFNLVIVGIGIIVGSWFATSMVGRWASHPAVDATGNPMLDEAGKQVMATNYTELFSVPMWIAVGCLVVLLLLYPGGRRQAVAVHA